MLVTTEDTYLTVSNAIDNKWSGALKPTEFVALRFILNRTLRYGKLSEVIPRRHVMKGVPKTEHGPCGISYRQWHYCIRALRAGGLIDFQDSPEAGGLVIEIQIQRIVRGPVLG